MMSDAAQATGMSMRRIVVVQAAILSLIGGSLYCIATDTEYWPLSHYPMYSALERPGPMSDLLLVGVMEGQPPREVPMRGPMTIRPFDWVRLRRAFQRMLEPPESSPRLRTALQDCLVRYEARRKARHPQRPAMQAVRLYRLWWDEAGPHAPRSAEQMTRRELVAEVGPPAEDR